MLTRLWNRIRKKQEVVIPAPEKPRGIFTTDDIANPANRTRALEEAWSRNFKDSIAQYIAQKPGYAMDGTKLVEGSGMDQCNIKQSFPANSGIIPEAQLLWYAGQTFIGYQLAAMLAQNWLISKACLMPAKDATRMGYELTVNDGTDVDPKVLDAIRKADVRYKLNKNMIEFVQMGRVFGIRIAMFLVESADPKYYEKPFNPDGVTPGSYKGISQIDPYWITPQLDSEAAGNPMSIDFYEPTWWRISGTLVHKSHLVIFKTEELSDILKPTYIWGGVPIPQKIMERVYAAERTANEAPMLALTKRTDVINIDLAQALSNQESFDQKLQRWVATRDNYGIKALGLDESMNQFDTSLTDLDAVIMTQFQIVAAAANIPAVKLMGTTPKGFNATGEYEEANYHEELESIQKHDLTPLIERHHLLLIRSEIAPLFNVEPFPTTVTFNSLDAMTAKEQAELNKIKAETDNSLMMSGAIDGQDIRDRIVNDPKSGYNGIQEQVPEMGEEQPPAVEAESDPEGA